MLGVGGSWTRARQEERQSRRGNGSQELIFTLQSIPETGSESEFSGEVGVRRCAHYHRDLNSASSGT